MSLKTPKKNVFDSFVIKLKELYKTDTNFPKQTIDEDYISQKITDITTDDIKRALICLKFAPVSLFSSSTILIGQKMSIKLTEGILNFKGSNFYLEEQ